VRGLPPSYDDLCLSSMRQEGRTGFSAVDLLAASLLAVEEANYLVTGNDDLLVLREVGGVKIATPVDFLDMLKDTAS
jgi:hypothetical protein